MQKTTLAKKEEVSRNWVLINLEGKVLGRAATRIADILRGKTKVIFTPFVDAGDFVVAINVEKIRLTGRKWDQKIYYKHTGFKGGLKETTARELLAKKPSEILRRAVKGMLPKNNLSHHLLKKLKIYSGSDHPHAAQQPKELKI